MTENRIGLVVFLVFLIAMAVVVNWKYWKERTVAAPTPDYALEQQIVADLSNLPPHIGDPQAPIVIRVSLDPKHGGPCTKGTIEFIRQLVRDYRGKVQAYFHKVSHQGKSGCAADLTINGRKTFTVTVGDKLQTVTIHGTARPGDSMSFLIRQIVEQEIAKATQKKGGEGRQRKGQSSEVGWKSKVAK